MFKDNPSIIDRLVKCTSYRKLIGTLIYSKNTHQIPSYAVNILFKITWAPTENQLVPSFTQQIRIQFHHTQPIYFSNSCGHLDKITRIQQKGYSGTYKKHYSMLLYKNNFTHGISKWKFCRWLGYLNVHWFTTISLNCKKQETMAISSTQFVVCSVSCALVFNFLRTFDN